MTSPSREVYSPPVNEWAGFDGELAIDTDNQDSSNGTTDGDDRAHLRIELRQIWIGNFSDFQTNKP